MNTFGKHIILILGFIASGLANAQNDYSKYRLYDSGYVDFTTKNTQFVNKAPFELPWLYQGKNNSVTFIPVGINQANRYTFIQDTASNLRYYADHAGVYSNRSGILFRSYSMNKKIPKPGCWTWDSMYAIPNTSFKCGAHLDTLENYGYTNCIRFGKTNHYGVGIWDYLRNGFRLLRLNYTSTFGDTIVSSAILPNAGKFTTITCGPSDSTFWVVSLLNNMHTIQVYLWSYSSLQLNQTFELGDTSNIKAYAHRMKFSPDNSKMVLLKKYKNSTSILMDQSNPQNTSYLFDFNAQNGILSNKQKVSIYGNSLEFSPNSKYLYIKHSFSTMDSNKIFSINNSNSGDYFSRFELSTNSVILLPKRTNNGSFSFQLLPDGNIYWKNTIDKNLKYVFERFEHSNDSQKANFKTYISNIDAVIAFRYLNSNSTVGYNILPEILPCKCYEPEPKPAKMESCGKDTLVVQNHFKNYDSLSIDWGDGSTNVYKQLDSTFKHGYAHSGQYIVKTNYSNVFQEFSATDTVITLSPKPLTISRDTFICPKATLALDLAVHDSNLIWSSTSKSLQRFYQSGNFTYQYKNGWCLFLDSVHVVQKVKPWNVSLKDTAICPGEMVTVTAPSNYKISWDRNPSDTVAVKVFNTTGLHELSFSDGYCQYHDSFAVQVSSPMNLNVVQVDTTVCHLLNPIEFQISGNSIRMKLIFWNSEQTNSLQFATNALSPIKISVVDTFGCREDVQITPISSCHSHIYIPNAFTPNGYGPGANEFFKPVITDGILKTFKIYNRWGQKVFDNPGIDGWDGMDGQSKAMEGVYVYEIEVITSINGIQYVNRYMGNFELLR